MRRGRAKDIGKYIDVRVNQLEEDLDKARDVYDKRWYTRLINELKWAQSQLPGKESRNCYMDREIQ